MRRSVVLVPLDGSVPSKSALPAARRMAGAIRAELAVLHVTPEPVTVGELASRLGFGRSELGSAELLGATGSAAAEICRVARERDVALIVMSSPGTRLSRRAERRPSSDC